MSSQIEPAGTATRSGSRWVTVQTWYTTGSKPSEPDLPGLARGLVEAGGQPDPVAQSVADGVESLGDRRREAELARVDDAAGHDELERAGTGGAGRFGEQRVVARRGRGPPLALRGQGRVHQLVSSRGESQDVCGTCLEAGVSRFIWVGRIARFGLLLMPGSSSGRRASCARCFRYPPCDGFLWCCACFEAGRSWEAPAARGRVEGAPSCACARWAEQAPSVHRERPGDAEAGGVCGARQ